jgi:hypothetical protein
MPVMNRFAVLTLLCVLAGCEGRKPEPVSTQPTSTSDEAASPQQVFEKRILPIFKSPDPSSCVQCHLAGVDLKNYILPSHEKTFVSLRDQGLIDLDKPEKSKILTLIRMGAEDNSGASLIHQKVRQAEYEAFADWIKRSAADPKLRSLPKLEHADLAGPQRPVEVIRHARKDQLLESFTNTIWALRFRCMSCHTEGTAENKKHAQEHGERVTWIKAAGPEATLAYLRTTKLIDTANPENSLLLRKPLNLVKHGGGQKFQMGDQGYKAFRTFITDYARIVGNQYADASALPKRPSQFQFGTEIWFKLNNTPEAWGDRLLQVNLYAWDSKATTWEAEPIATSDRGVWGKGKLWQHTLTLLAAKDSERAKNWANGKARLPRGRYLVKVFVDRDNRLANDWQAVLGPEDFVGQGEVESGWPEGYGPMTVLEAGRVRK